MSNTIGQRVDKLMATPKIIAVLILDTEKEELLAVYPNNCIVANIGHMRVLDLKQARAKAATHNVLSILNSILANA